MSTHDSTHSNHPHDAIARAREWSEMTLDSARARRVAGIDHQETKAYDQARTALSRGGAPLLVGGPAGSGKSVLMSTLAGRAREEGILADEGLVLFVRGADIEDVGGLAGLLRQVADTLALPSGTW